MLKYEFTVEGTMDFPIDMLRYDTCWPKSESTDSVGIAASFARRGSFPKRQIKLVGLKEPTVGRWHSFGWKVIDSQKRG